MLGGQIKARHGGNGSSNSSIKKAAIPHSYTTSSSSKKNYLKMRTFAGAARGQY